MNFARLLRTSTHPDFGIDQLDGILQAWAERDREQERDNRTRAMGVEMGLYQWFSLNHPHEAIDEAALLAEEDYRIEGMWPWVWLRQHKLECFRHVPRTARPLCGARTRSGASCKMRVHLREDGSLSARCKLHGGASTGPKSKKGRAAIAASNRRRAQLRRESPIRTSDEL